MRFLHLGDLHIGKLVNDFSMIEDQKYILDRILQIIKDRKVDGLLIAGDVYDKAIPTEEAVKVFDEFLCKLAGEKVNTYIISGNHDSDERMNFGSSFFRNSNIFITAKFNGMLAHQSLEEAGRRVNIYMLPFVKASQVRRFYPEETIENYEDAVRLVIEQAHLNKTEKNILLAHQFVCGKAEDPEFGGSENPAVLNVGSIEKIGYDIFDDFDYVALGHIHSPQRVGREQVRYSGSPLSYSLSEAGRDKSLPLIEIAGDGPVKIEQIPLVPVRKMRVLKGQLKNIIDPANVTDEEDYIFVTLTDEDPIPNAINIIRESYPNLMGLKYDNSHSKEIMQVDLRDLTKGKSFTDLISEFYTSMYGCEISEEELKIMKEVAREAGVEYEAD